MTEFTQLYLTPKIFLMGSSLAFSLKEDPERCAKVCDKSWVILVYFWKLQKPTLSIQWQVICRGAYQELKILPMGIGKAPFCSQHSSTPVQKSKTSFAGLGGKSASSKSGRRKFEPGQAPISLSSSKLERRNNFLKIKEISFATKSR